MRRDGWHILHEGGAYTLSRRLPVRFDVAARTVLPARRKGRLAHQVRQDLWRALRSLRGFAPAVRVEEAGGALAVTAGGAVEGRFARAQVEARISTLLEDPVLRARWIRGAA